MEGQAYSVSDCENVRWMCKRGVPPKNANEAANAASSSCLLVTYQPLFFAEHASQGSPPVLAV